MLRFTNKTGRVMIVGGDTLAMRKVTKEFLVWMDIPFCIEHNSEQCIEHNRAVNALRQSKINFLGLIQFQFNYQVILECVPVKTTVVMLSVSQAVLKCMHKFNSC